MIVTSEAEFVISSTEPLSATIIEYPESTVNVSLFAQVNAVVDADEIVVLQSPAQAELLYKKKQKNY